MNETENKESNNNNKDKQLVVFKLNEEEYGLNINNVKEIIRLANITPVPQAPEFVLGVLNIRGKILPVIDLKKRFLMEETEITPSVRIIIVEVKDLKVGLKVDSASEVISIDKDCIDLPPDFLKTKIDIDFINGVGKINDRLIIILDINRIFDLDELEELSGDNKEK